MSSGTEAFDGNENLFSQEVPFSGNEINSLVVTERVASAFSIAGCLFVIATFTFSKEFRRPVNRLIFWATLGNLAMNVGTAVSLDGIKAGRGSHLCQFQGFLIQMFLPADAFWNLSMAVNVYFTVFRKYNAEQLRKLEWIYLVFNYGATFVIAFVLCFINTRERNQMYGPATLWCWIDLDWVKFRIALVYAPAWTAILASFVIYIIAGRHLFQRRRELQSSDSTPAVGTVENPFTAFKTTTVQITSELATYPLSDPMEHLRTSSRSSSTTNMMDVSSPVPAPVSVSLDPESRAMSNSGYHQYTVSVSKGERISLNPLSAPSSTTRHRIPSSCGQVKARDLALDANKAAWGYTKCAMLFFLSLLITWVPSSIFRVHSLVTSSPGHFPLAYATGLVLPLMGFWNAVIYVTTSWEAVLDLVAATRRNIGRLGARNNRVDARARWPRGGEGRWRAGSAERLEDGDGDGEGTPKRQWSLNDSLMRIKS